MAVDNSEGTYWASKFDDTGKPVTLTLDVGGENYVQDMTIEWEFPAKAFSISTSTDGNIFTEAYSTDVNNLMVSHVPLGQKAKFIKIVMTEVRLRLCSISCGELSCTCSSHTPCMGSMAVMLYMELHPSWCLQISLAPWWTHARQHQNTPTLVTSTSSPMLESSIRSPAKLQRVSCPCCRHDCCILLILPATNLNLSCCFAGREISTGQCNGTAV